MILEAPTKAAPASPVTAGYVSHFITILYFCFSCLENGELMQSILQHWG